VVVAAYFSYANGMEKQGIKSRIKDKAAKAWQRVESAFFLFLYTVYPIVGKVENEIKLA
jgi:hypothetical protein